MHPEMWALQPHRGNAHPHGHVGASTTKTSQALFLALYEGKSSGNTTAPTAHKKTQINPAYPGRCVLGAGEEAACGRWPRTARKGQGAANAALDLHVGYGRWNFSSATRPAAPLETSHGSEQKGGL